MVEARSDAPRVAPLQPPYEDDVAETLRRMMPPGMEPLKLFRTIAHNRQILDKVRSTGAYLLNYGMIDPLERETLISRTCARCGSEYEWGVHVTFYGTAVGLSPQQIEATVKGSPNDPVWSERQALLIRLADELHETARVSDGLWEDLAARWNEAQLVELIALVGQYHTVSYLTNVFRVELEDGAPRFAGTLVQDSTRGAMQQ
jgi:4-carboxymuconolactone decarboxylase